MRSTPSDTSRPLRARHVLAATACALLVACSTTVVPTPATPTAPPTSAAPSPAPSPTPSTPDPSPPPTAASAPLTGDALAATVEAGALAGHLEALQAIADASPGRTRATGTPGFEASVEYVGDVLALAGYDVEERAFDADGVPSMNLLAQRRGRGQGGVVMLGAHLDSVVDGPGINDNGSGVAALLALAAALAEVPDQPRTVRFAFWGAEEGGQFGSAAYVESLAPTERDEIAGYLNFDMLGSPNAVRFVYDEADAAAGSEALTTLLASHLEAADLAWEPIDLEGDSDHGPFAEADIPTGGLFSGGIEAVTDEQATRHGAVAGEPADACSHRACDRIDNVDLATLTELTRIVAHALVDLAAGDA